MPSTSSSAEERKNGPEAQTKKMESINPDYIIVDGVQIPYGDQKKGTDSRRTSQTNKQSAPKRSLRFICLLGAAFCLVFGCGIILSSVVLLFLSALTFFRNPQLIRSIRLLWRFATNSLVGCFGFLVGVINPVWGLTLLALYFSLKEGEMNKDVLQMIMGRVFK